MGTGANQGMCYNAGTIGYCNKYDCSTSSGVQTVNAFLYGEGFETIPDIKMEPRKTEESYCVNKYTHCQAKNGTKLGDETVCSWIPAGCNLGIEAQCNECTHPASVKKGDDGLYHPNDYGYRVIINSARNEKGRYAGFATCPTGYKKCSGYGCCYRYCYLDNVADCRTGDILASCPSGSCTRSDTLAPGATRVAHVYYNYNRNLRLISLAKGIPSMNWDDAQASAPNYAPAGFESHPIIGKTKWRLPTSGGDVRPTPTYNGYYASTGPYMAYYGPANTEGTGIYSTYWTTREGPLQEGETIPSTAYRGQIGDGDVQELKEYKRNIIYLLDYKY